MALNSIGDLAQGFVLRARNTALKQSLTRLGDEVASGRVADPVARLGGHLSYLSRIEHDLTVSASYATGAKEVQIAATAMQASLERVGEVSTGLVETLSLASTAAGPGDISTVVADARGALDSVISALNTSAAGRHLFSGVAVDTAPLPPAEDLLAGLRAAMAPALSPSDALAAADSFFDPGGGFETLIYQGATDSLAPVQLGAGESADIDLRADHAALRDTMKTIAVAALVDDPGLSLTTTGRRGLFGDLLNGLLTAKDAQVAVQADLGFAEERIARAHTRIEAEMTTLRMARNELLAADPYEAATEMEAVQLQLETLYTVTARSSRLNLVNFLS